MNELTKKDKLIILNNLEHVKFNILESNSKAMPLIEFVIEYIKKF